jgi:hypothetical protein
LVEPAHVSDLSARVGVEAGRVEHDFALVAGLERLHPDAVFDECKDSRAVDAEGGVALELRLGQLAIDRRSRLLRPTLPRCACALLLFVLGRFKAFHIEGNPRIASRVDHEV